MQSIAIMYTTIMHRAVKTEQRDATKEYSNYKLHVNWACL